MTDSRPEEFRQGPPIGDDMSSFVLETKTFVLERITGKTRHSRRRGQGAAIVKPYDVAALPQPVETARPKGFVLPARAQHPTRNALIALSGIAVAVVIVATVGTNLVLAGVTQQGNGPVSGAGELAPASTPAPAAPHVLDESTAIAIARASNNAQESTPAEARLMTYGSWTSGYGEQGEHPAVDPSQLVWVVSVNGPATFPGLGAPGSSVPPSDGFTVTINALSGNILAFSAQPTTFSSSTDGSDSSPESCASAAVQQSPSCDFALVGTGPLLPGQQPLNQAGAITAAVTGYGDPTDSRTEAKLIPFSDWPANYGGSDFTAVDRDRPVWVVIVYAAPIYRWTGPPGSTPPPSGAYTVLIDSYSGHVMEFVSGPARSN